MGPGSPTAAARRRAGASLGLLFFLAQRSLIERPLTASLLVLAVAVGVGFQIPNTANLHGYSAELLEQGITSGFGDVRVMPAKGALFEDGDALAAQLAGYPHVIAAVPLLSMAGAVARDGTPLVAPVLGVSSTAPRAPYRIASGGPIAPGDRDGVLLGTALARRLELGVGDPVELRVILSSPDADLPSQSAQDLLRDGCSLGLPIDCSRLAEAAAPDVRLRRYTMVIRGLVVGTFSAYEAVFVDRAFLADQAESPRSATHVLVFTDDHQRARPVAAHIGADHPEVRASAWMDDSPHLKSAVDSAEAVSTVSHGMVVTAVVIPVWALLYIDVLHRRREVGLLGALGFRRREVFAAFLLQALLVGLAGVAAGALIGYGLIRYFQAYPIFDADGFVIRPLLTLGSFLEPAAVVLAATVVAGVYPAWRAARLDPAKILRGLS